MSCKSIPWVMSDVESFAPKEIWTSSEDDMVRQSLDK